MEAGAGAKRRGVPGCPLEGMEAGRPATKWGWSEATGSPRGASLPASMPAPKELK